MGSNPATPTAEIPGEAPTDFRRRLTCFYMQADLLDYRRCSPGGVWLTIRHLKDRRETVR
ncbi:hypothetical protein SGL43_03234 [Streptomyces globisporus]|uniref:MarR family transcriptional regulator n=1 Tax=Streptomyces globisporus TaxID=1908 RepID=A0ABM9GYI4_STRGL|nr:hypothetical protein SGL43_03234 [Streptomyces globisporus]